MIDESGRQDSRIRLNSQERLSLRLERIALVDGYQAAAVRVAVVDLHAREGVQVPNKLCEIDGRGDDVDGGIMHREVG